MCVIVRAGDKKYYTCASEKNSRACVLTHQRPIKAEFLLSRHVLRLRCVGLDLPCCTSMKGDWL